MAATAHKTKEEIQEHFDSPEELKKKAQTLANWIKESKHFIAFTGAGISTSAGVPDFRGPEGAWTLRATGEKRKSPTVSTLKAVPTKTHMSLIALQKAGMLKALVSQNTDGLHRKSGFPPEKLAELHGNSNKETCTKCKKEYIRDFKVREAKEVHDHITTRLCSVCGGKLQDSIINFGENLPERDLDFGFEQGNKADLCLALGSSLRVTPAADIPKEVAKRKKRLVICNLQKTPLDGLAALHIHAKTDDLMALVMEYLTIDIPPFVLHRRVLLEPQVFEGVATIDVKGIDVDNLPVTFITKIVVGAKTYEQEPFRLRKHANKLKDGKFKFELNFMGHYGEPPLEMEIDMNGPKLYCLDYNFNEKKWNVQLNSSPSTNSLELD